MLELIIGREDKLKKIVLIENGKLLEYYEDDGNSNRNEGNIYVGNVKDIVRGMQSAFVDIGTERNAFIHLKDILPKVNEKEEKPNNNIDIKDVIRVNDKILVQIKKDSDDKKGARISTHISLPSRYLVLMPETNIITISQKIEDKNEKQRLLNIMRDNLPENMGAIIRTSAKGKKEELIKDLKCVMNKWNNIQKKYNGGNLPSPQLIYKSQDVVEKIIIDTFSNGLEKIIINNKKDLEDVLKFKEENEELKNIEVVLKDKEDVLVVYDIEKQIKKINDRKVWLKCGGFITIDKTEALTAIDVNTGKYTGKKSLEETVYRVNEEATYEIAKQLKLRDIGRNNHN